MAALDGTNGNDLWQQPGRASYADGLATGDGGTYVLDEFMGITAYDLDSGDVRWQIGSQFGEPQSVAGDGIIMLWEAYVGIRETADGSVRWEAWGPLTTRLMNSAETNDELLFVAANTLPFQD